MLQRSKISTNRAIWVLWICEARRAWDRRPRHPQLAALDDPEVVALGTELAYFNATWNSMRLKLLLKSVADSRVEIGEDERAAKTLVKESHLRA